MISFFISIAVFFVCVSLLIIFGTRKLPQSLAAVNDAFKGADYSRLPALRVINNRNKQQISFRYYAAGNVNEMAILIHGSTANSVAMHMLAVYLQDNGVTCYVPDIRGHGATGKTGDIDYEGQLEDDLEDLITSVKAEHPSATLKLVGHSAGGGFALRFAGSKNGNYFSQYILAAPMIHHACPMTRAKVGGWAVPFIPRIVGLTILNSLGLRLFQWLPVIAFAVPKVANASGENSAAKRTSSYSFRLQRNFRPHMNWQADVKNIKTPTFIIVGENDELFVAEAYKPNLEPMNSQIKVQLLPGVGHSAVYSDPDAMHAILKVLKGQIAA